MKWKKNFNFVLYMFVNAFVCLILYPVVLKVWPLPTVGPRGLPHGLLQPQNFSLNT